MKDILENNLSDNMAIVLKTYANVLPFIGVPLGEIITQIIPNQRLDRIAKYLCKINENVEKLNTGQKLSSEKINLIEIGLKLSANATFLEKCEWISNIVNQGLSDDIEISTADNIINIVSQLNNEQMIILYYYVTYYFKSWPEKTEFTNRFKHLFNFGHFITEDPEKYHSLKNKEKFNFTTLVSLGLLENDFDIINLDSFGISRVIDHNDVKMLQSQLYELNKSIIECFREGKYKATYLGNFVIGKMNIIEELL